jgi:hypothetical protein
MTDELKPTTITISEADRETARKLGKGNISLGFRIMAERERGRKLTAAELRALADAVAKLAEGGDQ